MFLEGFENHSSVFFSLGSSFLVFWISMLGRIWECLGCFFLTRSGLEIVSGVRLSEMARGCLVDVGRGVVGLSPAPS